MGVSWDKGKLSKERSVERLVPLKKSAGKS